ncbi:hypothetical protein SNC69_02685, partial [Escherichia coli]|nr:hypothetical protein [Escherichia coli]
SIHILRGVRQQQDEPGRFSICSRQAAVVPPVILDALAEDRITTEHCQALALENDTARQVQVFEAACQSGWGG